jgi:hypothetical protein
MVLVPGVRGLLHRGVIVSLLYRYDDARKAVPGQNSGLYGEAPGTYEHSSDRSEVIVVSACGSAIPWVNVSYSRH